MKLLHHSQGYSQMYILYTKNRTFSSMCVTVVRVDRARREPCLPEGELSPVLHTGSGLRNREAPSQRYRSIAIQTPEGTVMLHATAPCLGAIFSPEHFGPYLEDMGRTRVSERERERVAEGARDILCLHSLLIVTLRQNGLSLAFYNWHTVGEWLCREQEHMPFTACCRSQLLAKGFIKRAECHGSYD